MDMNVKKEFSTEGTSCLPSKKVKGTAVPPAPQRRHPCFQGAEDQLKFDLFIGSNPDPCRPTCIFNLLANTAFRRPGQSMVFQ